MINNNITQEDFIKLFKNANDNIKLFNFDFYADKAPRGCGYKWNGKYLLEIGYETGDFYATGICVNDLTREQALEDINILLEYGFKNNTKKYRMNNIRNGLDTLGNAKDVVSNATLTYKSNNEQ